MNNLRTSAANSVITVGKKHSSIQSNSVPCCSIITCRNPAVGALMVNRDEKTATLFPLTEFENPPRATMYCKKHSNRATVPLGWSITRELELFADYELEQEAFANTPKIAQPMTARHPVFRATKSAAKLAPKTSLNHTVKLDNDLTRMINAIQRPVSDRIVIPERFRGISRGTLTLIKTQPEEGAKYAS